MSEVTQLPGTKRKEIMGPARFGNDVIVDGRNIPRLAISETTNGFDLFLDDRFCIEVARDDIHQVAWMVAQALAVGAGYSHIGAEKHGVPFAPEIVELGTAND